MTLFLHFIFLCLDRRRRHSSAGKHFVVLCWTASATTVAFCDKIMRIKCIHHSLKCLSSDLKILICSLYPDEDDFALLHGRFEVCSYLRFHLLLEKMSDILSITWLQLSESGSVHVVKPISKTEGFRQWVSFCFLNVSTHNVCLFHWVEGPTEGFPCGDPSL